MVGFTAWSSVREPEQVFTLLETVYHSFDNVAKKLKVRACVHGRVRDTDQTQRHDRNSCSTQNSSNPRFSFFFSLPLI